MYSSTGAETLASGEACSVDHKHANVYSRDLKSLFRSGTTIPTVAAAREINGQSFQIGNTSKGPGSYGLLGHLKNRKTGIPNWSKLN